MNSNDKKRFFDFYKEALEKYGDDARSLHWIDEESQSKRFEVLNQIADLNNTSVLDVGCGLGDLCKFFILKNKKVDYTGIDIIPEFIICAKEKFPGIKFRVEDIFQINKKYDYVLACGALNFNLTDGKNYYFSMIRKMFKCARKGLAFNMLNETVHKKDEIFLPQNLDEVTTFCKTLTKNVTVISDYVPWDFTIYMYK